MFLKISKNISWKRIFSAFLLILILINSFPLSSKAQEGYATCNDSNFSQFQSPTYLKNLNENDLLKILDDAEAICNILSLTNGKIDPYFNRGATEFPSSSYICGEAEQVKQKFLWWTTGIKDEMINEAAQFIAAVFRTAPAVISQLGCPDPSTNTQLIESANLSSKSISALKALCRYCENPNSQNTNKIQNIAEQIRGKLILSEWWQATKEVTVNTAKDIEAYVEKVKDEIRGEDCINLTGWKIAKDLITFSFFQFIEDIVFIPLVGILRHILQWIIQVWIWFLTPQNFGGYIDFPPVKILWNYLKNFSYLGIILSFLFMAIAQILHIKEYGWEKILWRIVVVALLINFSLVLCGIFVDLSNYLTSYFVSAPPIYGDAPTATAGLEIKIPRIVTKIACHFKGDEGTLVYSTGLFLSLILVIIFIGQFAGILLYTVIRIVTLWLTIILSPLAAIAFIFPQAKNLWQTWRNYFTQALLSLPIIAFCLWLTVGMLDAFVTGLNQIGTKQPGTLTIIPALAHAILLGILAQSTLTVAGALGVKEINQGYKTATKLIWGGLGAAAGYTFSKGVKGLTSSESWRKTAETLEKSNLQLVHNLGTTMKDVSQKTREGELSNLSKRADKMTDDQVRQEIERYMKWNDRRSTAVLVDKLVERGKLSTGDPNDKENIKNLDDKALAFAKDYVNVSQLKKVNPYEYVKYYSKDEDIKKHLEDIRRESPNLSPEQEKQELYNRLLIDYASTTSPEKLAEGRWQEIFDHIKNSQENEKLGNDKLIEVLNKLVNNLTPEAMAAIARSMETNQQYTFIENVKKAVEPEASAVGKSARDYLLENKGYGSLRYFQGTLGRIPTEPKEESYSDGYKLHKVDKDKGIWLPPSNPPKEG